MSKQTISESSGSPMLVEDDKKEIGQFCLRLFELYHKEADRAIREECLRQYLELKARIVDRGLRFGIANNRIFVGETSVSVPFLLGNTILVFVAADGLFEMSSCHQLADGAVITDQWILEQTAYRGRPVDLESELYELDLDRCDVARISHLRDMAQQLESISRSVNRAEATFLLRALVAQTSLMSFKEYMSAKNLQTEVSRLQGSLLHFLNSPLANRLPFLIRILVRNISGVVAKPKLIDRLWHDTIELAEVHLRGSQIVNEIRRSTHHAIGKRTLLTVQSYLQYLETGNAGSLIELGYPEPGPADQEARNKLLPRKIIVRIQEDLEELMGDSDVTGRISDWQARFTDLLTRCDTGESLEQAAEQAIVDGLRDDNKWMFYHHLRSLLARVVQFPGLPATRNVEDTLNRMMELELDDGEADASAAEAELRDVIHAFSHELRRTYQVDLFEALESLKRAFGKRAYFDCVVQICELRRKLRSSLIERAFPEQKLLAYELDCLLEELGFVSMRHIADSYESDGMDLAQCRDIISRCALNLTHDGLFSRQLLDLTVILADSTLTFQELRTVLQQIQRNYQHITRQLNLPFEKLQSRLTMDDRDMQTALANMKRNLHDLNTMAAFADMALEYVDRCPAESESAAQDAGGRQAPDADEPPIVHFSHHDELSKLIEMTDKGCRLRDSYGSKGSGIAYISYLNIPTPDGFVLPTALARRRALDADDAWLDQLVAEHLQILEGDINAQPGPRRAFGDPENPLLLSVRGGSVFSMPGILATVLFVGMNDDVAQSLAKTDPWHAYDSYRRFLASYAYAAWGFDVEAHGLVEKAKTRYRVKYKDALPWEAMRDVAEGTKELLREEGHGDELDTILKHPVEQLVSAVRAVMNSWNHPTCKWYRELKGICDSWNTAVTIQEMSSGNRQNEAIRPGMDETSASLTGVISRSAVTDSGLREPTGEFKFSACGEDLVGGLTISTSFMPISDLKIYMPMLYRRLKHKAARLRHFMGTDQEIEFTVDRGVLSVLQSRAAEIGGNRNTFAFEAPPPPITRGIGIRGSAFRGVVAFDEDDFNELKGSNVTDRDDVDGILMVLENPSPADIPLVLLAGGLLAAKGGSTSHAAIAINGIEDRDYSAVMSAGRLSVDRSRHEAVVWDEDDNPVASFRKGDVVSIHGSSGQVFMGSVPTSLVGL